MPSHVKVATWNLESANTLTVERRDAFRTAMGPVEADVWVLTETWAGFSPGNKFTLSSGSARASDLSPKRRWVTIWTRSDLPSAKVNVEIQGDRMACCRIERRDRPPLLVIGTVLPWSNDPCFLGGDGYCQAVSEQEREWARLKQEFSCELVIAGDFNQSLPFVSRFGTREGEAALDRAFESLEMACVTKGRRVYSELPRIDHIVAPKAVGVAAEGWPIPAYGKSQLTDHEGVAIRV